MCIDPIYQYHLVSYDIISYQFISAWWYNMYVYVNYTNTGMMALPWCHLRLRPSDSFTNFETFSKSWPSQTVPFTATTSSPSMINMPSAWNPMVLDWPENRNNRWNHLKPTRVPNMPLIFVMGQTNPSSVFKQHLPVPQVLGFWLYATLLLHHQCQEKPNTSQTHSKFQYCHLPTNSEVLKLSTFLIST